MPQCVSFVGELRRAFAPGNDGPNYEATQTIVSTILKTTPELQCDELTLLIQELRAARDDSTSPEMLWRTKIGRMRYYRARRTLATATVVLIARIKDTTITIDDELLRQLHDSHGNRALIAEELATIAMQPKITRYAIASLRELLWSERAHIFRRRVYGSGGMWTGIPDHQFRWKEKMILRAITAIQRRARHVKEDIR